MQINNKPANRLSPKKFDKEVSVIIMATQFNDKIKSQCVLWMHETGSPTAVRRKFCTKYGRSSVAPSRKVIRIWYEKFIETGQLKSTTKRGRKPVKDASVNALNELFTEQPETSVRQAAQHVPISKSSVQRVIKKRLKLFPYKIQLVQALKPGDYEQREQFARTLLTNIEQDPDFLNRILFSDEATFHVSGVVNRHNVRIWGAENPHVFRPVERNSPKLNVWCGLLHDRVVGPFFFDEATVKQDNFLDMLLQFAIPQVRDRQPHVIFQLDGAPPHWGLNVRAALDAEFPGRWIGRGGPTTWPPRSPDVTPLDFFFWGYIKSQVFQTPVDNLVQLRRRIRDAVQTVTNAMLTKTWRELLTRLECLRDNGGRHVEIY